MNKWKRLQEVLSLLREMQREGRERCSDEEKLEKIRKGKRALCIQPTCFTVGESETERRRDVLSPSTWPHAWLPPFPKSDLLVDSGNRQMH